MILITCLAIMSLIIISYFLISTTQNFSYQTSINATRTAVSRQIINKDKWQSWWPGGKLNDTLYSYGDCNYLIKKILLNGAEITIVNKNDSIKGFLQFDDYGIDSTQFQWTSNHIFSSNPLKRFSEYYQLLKVHKNIKDLLKGIKKYFDNQENVYGMKIEEEKITQSSLISVKDTFLYYPSTKEIYNMIQSLENYILKVNGEKVGFPMLHIREGGPNKFVTMVAIPTKTVLPSENKILLKQMVIGSPILVSKIKGGVQTIINGEMELSNYVNDYHKLSPAIPFQSLVTNRLSEPDSTKWVTKLYYPVF